MILILTIAIILMLVGSQFKINLLILIKLKLYCIYTVFDKMKIASLKKCKIWNFLKTVTALTLFKFLKAIYSFIFQWFD